MSTNRNQTGSTTRDPIAEIDVRNCTTGTTRHVYAWTIKEAAGYRVGMAMGTCEYVDNVWLFPKTLGRDY